MFYYYFYLVSWLFIAFAFSKLPIYFSFFFSVVLLVLFWNKFGINLVFTIISIILLLLLLFLWSFTFIQTRKIALFHCHVFIFLLLLFGGWGDYCESDSEIIIHFYYSFIIFFFNDYIYFVFFAFIQIMLVHVYYPSVYN